MRMLVPFAVSVIAAAALFLFMRPLRATFCEVILEDPDRPAAQKRVMELADGVASKTTDAARKAYGKLKEKAAGEDPDRPARHGRQDSREDSSSGLRAPPGAPPGRPHTSVASSAAGSAGETAPSHLQHPRIMNLL